MNARNEFFFRFRKFKKFPVDLIKPKSVLPGSNTLLIIANPCGSGKSSLLIAFFREKLPLFGNENLISSFRQTCESKSLKESSDYKLAWNQGTNFLN